MTQDELYELFVDGAGKSRWKVDKVCFPDKLGSKPMLPDKENIFKALETISPKKVKYLILGQDPYPTKTKGVPDATGIAFAVNRTATKNIPHSLRRIMKKIYVNGNGSPDLEEWRKKHQILLLNAALTVPVNKPGAHLEMWSCFTKSIIKQVKKSNPDVQMIAWGNNAMGTLCDALGLFTWSYHPAASKGGPKSFTAFWNTPVGKSLAS